MRLIVLLILWVNLVFGAAAIFNGNFVKILKDQFKLNNTCEIRTGSADPSAGAGVEAPRCSIYLKTDDGALWHKTGAGDTAWENNSDHNALDNTHNLTTDIDHDQLTNTHQDVNTTASPEFAAIEITDNNGSSTFNTVVDSSSTTSQTTADRTLTLDVDDGDRTLKLQANLTVEGTSILDQDLTRDANVRFNTVQLIDQNATSYWNEIVFYGSPANNDNKSLSINMQNDDRSISLAGNLTIEGSATLDQDLTSDAAPTFAGLTSTSNIIIDNYLF